MKHNRLNKRIRSGKWQTRICRTGLGAILVALLALLVFSVPESFAKKAVSEKLKEQDRKGQMEGESLIIAPKKNQPTAQLNPVRPQQTQVQPASAATDKGKQLKWQVVSSGSDCGTPSEGYRSGMQDGCELCGTVGQLAVGSGSSPSYGINSGFWQEDLQGYLRGDANGDGMINMADAVYLVNWLFIGGPAPNPLWVGDANCSGGVDLADAVYIVNWLFIGGPPPGC